MALEIERKFLVRNDTGPARSAVEKPLKIRQGYFARTPLLRPASALWTTGLTWR